MDYPDFGQRLRSIRRRQGLSQVELAEECDMTARTISNYEASHHAPVNIECVRKIAKALEVPLSDLLGGQAVSAPDNRTAAEKARDLVGEITYLFGSDHLDDKQKYDLMNKINRAYLASLDSDE